jgi:cAMP-dependent protein kinase regulator
VAGDAPSTPAGERQPDEGPDQAGAFRPRRSPDVTVHEVDSTREGRRHLLKHDVRGTCVDLPNGELDAFLWARMDGELTQDELALAYLQEHGSLHPDLGGLLQTLSDAGMLEAAAPGEVPDASPGRGLTALAGALLRVRIPLPFTQPVWRAIGRLTAPLLHPAAMVALLLLAALATAGLGGARLLLDRDVPGLPPLLLWGGQLGLGLLVLLGLNLLVDLLEAVGQVGCLARGGKPPGRIGLSLDALVPGIYIETPDAILLPLEQRTPLHLAPLLTSLLVTCAALATGGVLLGQSGAGALLALTVCHKLAWIGFLRALVHINPVGPGPLYDALRDWMGIPRLRGLALHYLRTRLTGAGERDEDTGFTRREVQLLAVLGATIVYLLGAARVGAYLLGSQVGPLWRASSGAGELTNLVLLSVPLVAVGVPTLLTLAAGLALTLQATGHAIRQSGLGSTTWRLAGSLAALSAALGAGLVAAPPNTPMVWPAVTALILCGVGGIGLGRNLGRTVRGEAAWGRLGLHDVGLCAPLLFVGLAWAGWLATDAVAWRSVVSLAELVAALAVVVAAATELSRSRPAWYPLVSILVAPAVVVGLGPLLVRGDGAPPAPAVMACGLAALASLLALYAAWNARSSRRGPSVVLLFGAALALSGSTGLEVLGRAGLGARVGLDMLAGLLLVSAQGVLLGAWRDRLPLPSPARARPDDVTTKARLQATLRYLVETVGLAVEAELGPPTLRALVGPLAADGLEWRDGQLVDTEPVADEDLPARGLRYRQALARLLLEARRRTGLGFVAGPLERALSRVPEKGQALLAKHVLKDEPALEPIARALKLVVPATERVRLLQTVPHLADLEASDLVELASCLGTQRLPRGAEVVRQGEQGDEFFVLARGSAHVYVRDGAGEQRLVATLRQGDAFGEAALLRHEPRGATVITAEDVTLLTLERAAFADFIRGRAELLEKVFARQDDLELVREVPLFAQLKGGQVGTLFRRFRPARLPDGRRIIEQGQRGDRFYLIREGRVRVLHAESAGADPREVATLERGDYFGEIALLDDSPRTATVISDGEVELLALDRGDVGDLLTGAARRELARRSRQRRDELGNKVVDS